MARTHAICGEKHYMVVDVIILLRYNPTTRLPHAVCGEYNIVCCRYADSDQCTRSTVGTPAKGLSVRNTFWQPPASYLRATI